MKQILLAIVLGLAFIACNKSERQQADGANPQRQFINSS